MKCFRAHFALVVLGLAFGLSCKVWAQAADPAQPIETVHVEGERDKDQRDKDQTAAQHFIMDFARKAPVADSYTLWRDKICPTTFGLTAQFNSFITQRVRAVATQIGAPVDTNDSCRTNIEIIFSTQPQQTLDVLRTAARKAGTILLGYDNVTTVKYPIQAWYGTATRDDNGAKTIDDPFAGPLTVKSHTGNRLFTGVTGEFGTILILANSNAVVGRELGAVADYIALIALSQTNAFDTCQKVSTIANLMAPNCPTLPTSLTDIDMAYLTGLYKSDNGGPELLQRNRILTGMKNYTPPK